MGKVRWQKLGLTPRQLSKKIGVTYSMAEFITQSYRTPVEVNCCPKAVCAHSPRWRQKSTKKSHCTSKSTYRGRGEKLLACAVPPVSCSRKRRRSKEEQKDCDFSGTPGRRLTSKDCPCKRSCKTSSRKVTRLKKRPSNPRRKRAKCIRTVQYSSVSPAPLPHQDESRMIPVNIHLDVPLNIHLDDEDCAEVERGPQLCMKKKNKITAAHVPCLRKESSTELMSEDCGAQEEISVEKCILNEDQSSSEEASCDEKTKAAEDCCPNPWQKKMRECLDFLECLLNSLVNKC